MADHGMPGAARLAARHVRDADEFVRGAALACLRVRGTAAWQCLAVESLHDECDTNRIEAIECLVAWDCGSAWPARAVALAVGSSGQHKHSGCGRGRWRCRALRSGHSQPHAIPQPSRSEHSRSYVPKCGRP